MKRRVPVILTIVVAVATVLFLRGRHRANAEAELWAAATDQI